MSKATEFLEPLTKVYRQDFLRETIVEFIRLSDVEPIIERLTDHLIFSSSSYYSYQDEGKLR